MLTDPALTDLADLDAFCGRLVAAATSPAADGIPATRFPRGLCSWACEGGGELLAENGFRTWVIWNAIKDGDNPWRRHSWLVRAEDDAFVDLTAHQFEGYSSYLVGRGRSPLEDQYPIHLATYDATISPSDATRRAWKAAIVAAMLPPECP